MPVKAAAQFIIKEMCQSDQPEAGVIKRIQIGDIALQRMPAFGAQYRPQNLLPVTPCCKQSRQILPCPDQFQAVRGAFRHALEGLCLNQSAFAQGKP